MGSFGSGFFVLLLVVNVYICFEDNSSEPTKNLHTQGICQKPCNTVMSNVQ